jgi:iron complex transport system ATP-binding protein
MLAAADLVFGYGARGVLDRVSLDVPEGRLVGLVGPNGAGKSTFLRCLSGALAPRSGSVRLRGADLATLRPAEIARRLAVVPQTSNPAFPVTVEYFVGMGRFAREPFLGGPSETDRAVVRRCLGETRLTHLASRAVDRLSGGEFRRVLIAQALVQEPEVILLDEPVQQLDLLHQLEVMSFARDFSRRGGTAGVVVLHDLELASRWCDAIVLLHRGRVIASGPPRDVLTADALRATYDVDVSVTPCPVTGALRIVPIAPARAGASTRAGGDD